MRRTTVLLPDDLAALLEDERRRRDVSTAALVREALEYYFTDRSDQRGFGFIGIGESGQSGERPGFAERVEEILAEEWTRDDLAGSRSR
jgi:hypothetical protein